MASVAAASGSPTTRSRSDMVVGFMPEMVAAPFFLRCASLFIDYMVMLSIPVAGLIGNKFLSDGTPYSGPGMGTITLLIIFWIVNFLLLPLLRGQTLGKFLTGTRILNLDGTNPNLFTIVRRNIFGYAITLVTLGVGFLTVVFSRKGRALHDLIGGTVVIRGKRIQI